jgi:hypothetical protein
MISIRGHSMCNGQHPTTCQLMTEDDPIVQRFRDAGAIILGEGGAGGSFIHMSCYAHDERFYFVLPRCWSSAPS